MADATIFPHDEIADSARRQRLGIGAEPLGDQSMATSKATGNARVVILFG